MNIELGHPLEPLCQGQLRSSVQWLVMIKPYTGAAVHPHKDILDTVCVDYNYQVKAINLATTSLLILFYKYITFQNLLCPTIYFPEIIPVATPMDPGLLCLRKSHTCIIFPQNLSPFGPKKVFFFFFFF